MRCRSRGVALGMAEGCKVEMGACQLKLAMDRRKGVASLLEIRPCLCQVAAAMGNAAERPLGQRSTPPMGNPPGEFEPLLGEVTCLVELLVHAIGPPRKALNQLCTCADRYCTASWRACSSTCNAAACSPFPGTHNPRVPGRGQFHTHPASMPEPSGTQ